MKLNYKYSLKTAFLPVLMFCFLPFALNAQVTSIPDQNFEQALIDLGIDSDGIINGQVLTSDIETVAVLTIRYKNIADLTGIEDFAALEELNILGNQLSSLDTSANLALRILVCGVNPLNSINITQNILLQNLEMDVNHVLDEIDLSNNINLNTLRLEDSWLDSIDISNNVNLKSLYLGGSGITEIDLSNNTLLEYLDVAGVHLSSLDLNNNIHLKELYCGNYGGDWGQMITSLDLSNNVNLELFYAENMFYLNSLNLKNGNNSILSITLPCEAEGEFCLLTDLYCIQVDDEVAATNGDFPYNSWYIDAEDFIYSEDCSLGVPTVENDSFSISQNPVRENLILLTSNALGKIIFQIYNIEGKLLSSENINFEKRAVIDVSHLSPGFYFLRSKDENGNSQIKKFIKE